MVEHISPLLLKCCFRVCCTLFLIELQTRWKKNVLRSESDEGDSVRERDEMITKKRERQAVSIEVMRRIEMRAGEGKRLRKHGEGCEGDEGSSRHDNGSRTREEGRSSVSVRRGLGRRVRRSGRDDLTRSRRRRCRRRRCRRRRGRGRGRGRGRRCGVSRRRRDDRDHSRR